MDRILVTGATGFIGSYIIDELVKQNFEVIATSTNEQKAREFSWFDRVVYREFDFGGFNNSSNYFEYFSRPHRLIHLAWQGLPNYKSLFHIEENLPVHYAFLKNMIQGGLSDVTVTGTCFEYGNAEGELREDMKTEPGNPYGLAKDTLRKFLFELQKFHEFRIKWVRLFYMYGKGQGAASLFSQLDKAIAAGQESFNMSGGEQVRDFLPVTEVAKRVVALALQDKCTGVINCCSGNPVKLRKLVEEYLINRNAEIRLNLGYYPYPDYEPMAFWGNNEKLLSALNTG
ncbi:NAD-dependent epimerase/dehydratase family protein [Hufsiella ginkgonis]|uniref:NAD-dependent epimerase/dehydratase family protein n=1 Tax=Hufsiella ginkgonis TaxID=2695274 RepID=A0A7K1Y2B3_9SPHI|nr:NAD-dependent epimerase/dehydratase family protein [Hufsiella ginkgonis]MXV17395.1 NAD-dependent epimerase/dehydratase family protein [Hufsiella ginkgonis]